MKSQASRKPALFSRQRCRARKARPLTGSGLSVLELKDPAAARTTIRLSLGSLMKRFGVRVKCKAGKIKTSALEAFDL